MRIRSIKPEFYTSEDIAALDWDTRLLFIGLWSYVDDNGVGRDVEQLILAHLFPLEDDPRETLAKVSRGLQTLFSRGQIVRYTVDGKPFLHVTAWEKHQKIDKPNKARYDLPTCENAVIRESVANVPRVSREIPAPGAVEQRSRGTEEERSKTPSPQAASAFDTFWASYPRKVGKDSARRAFIKASKRARTDVIIAGAERYGTDPNLPLDRQYIPHPSTWLNAGGWEDEPCAPRPQQIKTAARSTTDDRVAGTLALAARYADAESRPTRLGIAQ